MKKILRLSWVVFICYTFHGCFCLNNIPSNEYNKARYEGLPKPVFNDDLFSQIDTLSLYKGIGIIYEGKFQSASESTLDFLRFYSNGKASYFGILIVKGTNINDLTRSDFIPEKSTMGSIVQIDGRSFELYENDQLHCKKFTFLKKIEIKNDTLYARDVNFNKDIDVIEIYTKHPVDFSLANMTPDW
jgi:hypothetical protein